MKFTRFVIIISLMIVATMAIIPGCEFDVTPSQWEQGPLQAINDSILLIDPPLVAKAGVNTITITGKNFADQPDSNIVYVSQMNGDKNTVTADILTASSSSITIYRPNLRCKISCIYIGVRQGSIPVIQNNIMEFPLLS